MINYLDGRWHGWNGGKRPVPPLAVVEFVTKTGSATKMRARDMEWGDETAVVGFRVLNPQLRQAAFVVENGRLVEVDDGWASAAHGLPDGTVIVMREVPEGQ